jgi:single-strand DNA-binding protein
VYVSGPVSARAYQANNGETRVSIEVTADEVEFLSSRDTAEQSYQQQEREAIQQESAPAMVAVETEELPF